VQVSKDARSAASTATQKLLSSESDYADLLQHLVRGRRAAEPVEDMDLGDHEQGRDKLLVMLVVTVAAMPLGWVARRKEENLGLCR